MLDIQYTFWYPVFVFFFFFSCLKFEYSMCVYSHKFEMWI